MPTPEAAKQWEKNHPYRKTLIGMVRQAARLHRDAENAEQRAYLEGRRDGLAEALWTLKELV